MLQRTHLPGAPLGASVRAYGDEAAVTTFDAFLARACPGLDLEWRKYGRCEARRAVNERLRELGLPDYQAYLGLLRRDPGEAAGLADRMRITVTRFFRERERWQILVERILPELVAAAPPPRTVRAWSAGCCGGEEPYTLAIVWLERIAPVAPDATLEILATDIDEPSLARAREGVYAPSALREVPLDARERWFRREKPHFRVADAVRRMVRFEKRNLMTDPVPSGIDLALCRYLAFTYFTGMPRQQAARRLSRALRPGGVLMIGRKEGLAPAQLELFEPWPHAAGFFRRRDPASADAVWLPWLLADVEPVLDLLHARDVLHDRQQHLVLRLARHGALEVDHAAPAGDAHLVHVDAPVLGHQVAQPGLELGVAHVALFDRDGLGVADALLLARRSVLPGGGLGLARAVDAEPCRRQRLQALERDPALAASADAVGAGQDAAERLVELLDLLLAALVQTREQHGHPLLLRTLLELGLALLGELAQVLLRFRDLGEDLLASLAHHPDELFQFLLFHRISCVARQRRDHAAPPLGLRPRCNPLASAGRRGGEPAPSRARLPRCQNPERRRAAFSARANRARSAGENGQLPRGARMAHRLHCRASRHRHGVAGALSRLGRKRRSPWKTT